MKNENRAKNIIKITEKDKKKYIKLKEGEKFIVGDLIYLMDEEYVEVCDGNILTKQKVNKENIVLRKK